MALAERFTMLPSAAGGGTERGLMIGAAGTSRPSSASSDGRHRAGAFRAVRGANRLRIQERMVMANLHSERMCVNEQGSEPGAQTDRRGLATTHCPEPLLPQCA